MKTVNRETYIEERKRVKEIMTSEKLNYYNKKLEEWEGHQQKLFQVVDKLLNQGKQTALPEQDNLKELVNNFSYFFHDKIEKIRNSLNHL